MEKLQHDLVSVPLQLVSSAYQLVIILPIDLHHQQRRKVTQLPL